MKVFVSMKTYRVTEKCLEEFSAPDAVIQPLSATGILVQKNSVSKEATGLTR